MSPQAGDFAVTATGGWVAKVIRFITKSPVNHAFVYLGNDQIIEAQPGGAAISPVSKYPNAIWSEHQALGVNITAGAKALAGVPYNYIDVAAQAIVRLLGWQAPMWALRRLSDPRRLQCAQLVDYAYHLAGIELFHDRRPSGLVAPSDLYELIGDSRV